MTVRSRVRDADGAEVATLEGTATVEPGARGEVRAAARVARPAPLEHHRPAPLHRWPRKSSWTAAPPTTSSERFGFRDFRFDGKGFTLNGAPILLRGVGKHQETEAHLSAVTDDELRAGMGVA